MDKGLIDIRDKIQARSEDFNKYLNKLLPAQVWVLVNKLLLETNVYLFSGIIRDYFLEAENGFRDIDFVVDTEDIEEIISGYNFTKNSFGGYKIMIDSIPIDLWSIKNTWGFSKPTRLAFADYLPDTTFFNASSILFSLNNQKFIVGEPFLEFLNKKELDVVLKDNPEPALCIVNSIYYYKTIKKIKLSKRLKQYISNNKDKYLDEFDSVQQKHFKKIIYTKEELANFRIT